MATANGGFFARSISDGIARVGTYDAQGIWNMKTETEQIVTHALDQAIAGVVRGRYHQSMLNILGAPYEEGTDAGIASEKKNVLDAVNSLHENLRQLQPPAYDNPLVPLFYSAWYQPFQINLAYSLIMMIAEQRPWNPERTKNTTGGRLWLWLLGYLLRVCAGSFGFN